MYEIFWTHRALKHLKNLPFSTSRRILEAVDELRENPYVCDIKKLSAQPFYRLRIGDYRIIFDLQKAKLIILILDVGHRKKIYN